MKLKCLSIKQPWLNAILLGLKDRENRTWPTRHRGPLALHAPLAVCAEGRAAFPDLAPACVRGAVLGVADVVDCVEGPYGYAWLLADVRRLREPIPMKGRLSLWSVEIPDGLLLPGPG